MSEGERSRLLVANEELEVCRLEVCEVRVGKMNYLFLYYEVGTGSLRCHRLKVANL